MSNDAEVTIAYTKIKNETDKAILVDCEGDTVWLPKSQVTVDEQLKQIKMPEWLFKERFPNG